MKKLNEGLIGKHNIDDARSEYKYKNLKEIVNFKYKDLLEEGNIIEFEEDEKTYHGIVVSSDIAINIFNIYSSVILTPQSKSMASYWSPKNFRENFPKARFDAKIVKVYKLNKDISNLKTTEDFYDLFKEYDLKFIKRF